MPRNLKLVRCDTEVFEFHIIKLRQVGSLNSNTSQTLLRNLVSSQTLLSRTGLKQFINKIQVKDI